MLPLLGLHKFIKIQNCYSYIEGLGGSHEGSITIGTESLSSYLPRLAGSMGFLVMTSDDPSVYCEHVLLLLINKESALGLWQSRISQVRNPNRNVERK